MKAFHQSGTNLISVWKSEPRTAVLSEKVKCCFICHSNSNFTSLLKLLFFFFWSYHIFWHFPTFLARRPFTIYQQFLVDLFKLHLMKCEPITLSKSLAAQKEKVKLWSHLPLPAFVRSTFLACFEARNEAYFISFPLFRFSQANLK